MGDTVKKTVFIDNVNDASILYGNHDKYLKVIKHKLCVNLIARNCMVKVSGDKERVKTVIAVIEELIKIVKFSGKLCDEDVDNVIKSKTVFGVGCNKYHEIKDNENFNGENDDESFWSVDRDGCDESTLFDSEKTGGSPESESFTNDIYQNNEKEVKRPEIDVFFKDAVVRPKTAGQNRYVNTIKNNDVVFCIGPAGTGKTYLAVALALSALKNGVVKKIVLARPAVDAGEKLGFLPGDIQAKVNPYLRPLYDALSDMMDTVQVKKYLENDLIEILPLAFMRGRTLNNSFVILDEAQNCTNKQMKTFLTRLGCKSRIVVTGDVTQIDLPTGTVSGLIDVQDKLINIKGIDFVHLAKADIVRHKLVQDIVDAYEKFE